MWVSGGCVEYGANRAGPPRSERERARGRTVRGADVAGPKRREGVGARTRGKRRRQVGPTGQREGERARVVADRWDPPVRQHGHACGLAGLNGPNSVFLFLQILKCFSFYFSLWISNQIQTKFKFKSFHTCASNKRII
jgi:hypothetical protein